MLEKLLNKKCERKVKYLPANNNKFAQHFHVPVSITRAIQLWLNLIRLTA